MGVSKSRTRLKRLGMHACMHERAITRFIWPWDLFKWIKRFYRCTSDQISFFLVLRKAKKILSGYGNRRAVFSLSTEWVRHTQYPRCAFSETAPQACVWDQPQGRERSAAKGLPLWSMAKTQGTRSCRPKLSLQAATRIEDGRHSAAK